MPDHTDALLRLAAARDRLTVEPATPTRLAAQVTMLREGYKVTTDGMLAVTDVAPERAVTSTSHDLVRER